MARLGDEALTADVGNFESEFAAKAEADELSSFSEANLVICLNSLGWNCAQIYRFPSSSGNSIGPL